MLGPKHNINSLVDYDPEWAMEFAGESQGIADVLGSFAKGIEHYGSTAVTGMREANHRHSCGCCAIRGLGGMQSSLG